MSATVPWIVRSLELFAPAEIVAAARERDLQHAIGDLQPSGQVAAGRVDVGDRNPADRRGRLFGNRLCAGDRVERRVVDGADVDVDAAQRLVAAAASSRVAVVVDLHRDRVGVVAVQMRCAVQVLHVAGGVQERVQVGQRTGQGQHPAAAAADGDPAAAAGR